MKVSFVLWLIMLPIPRLCFFRNTQGPQGLRNVVVLCQSSLHVSQWRSDHVTLRKSSGQGLASISVMSWNGKTICTVPFVLIHRKWGNFTLFRNMVDDKLLHKWGHHGLQTGSVALVSFLVSFLCYLIIIPSLYNWCLLCAKSCSAAGITEAHKQSPKSQVSALGA